MRNITELIDNVQPAPAMVAESASGRKAGDVVKAEAADRIMADDGHSPAPDVLVADNEKMRKLADVFASQIRKKCSIRAYCHPMLKMVDGARSVLLFLSGGNGAVTITPTGDGNPSTVLRWYSKYDASSDTQNASFAVSSSEMGVTKMLNVFFDIIGNPEGYSGVVNEARVKQDFSTQWEKGKMDVYRKEVEAVLDPNRTSNMKNVTAEGIRELVDILKNNPDIDPYRMAKDMVDRTAAGRKYLEILYGGNIPDRGNSDYKLCAVVQKVCELANIEITKEKEVGIVDGGVSDADRINFTYEGVDLNFLHALHIEYNEFRKAISDYEQVMDDMKYWIKKFVNYSRLGRLEKAEKRGGVVALFISGSGGVGKTQTLKDVIKEMNLVEGKDYAERGNATSAAGEVYEFCYHNNGRMLVFDDTPNILSSDFASSFWKFALESPKPGASFPVVQVPNDPATRFYSIDSCTQNGVTDYRKMYYLECPKSIDPKILRKMTEEEQEKAKKESVIRMMPNKMEFMSKVVIVTNVTERELERDLKQSWEAIRSRSVFYTVAPPKYILWAKIKQKLIRTRDEKKDDGFVPYEFVDEVIEFVEDKLKAGEAKYLNFRTFATGSIKELMIDGRPWKLTLANALNKTESNE